MRIDYKKYNLLNNKCVNIKIIHISDIHFSLNYNLRMLEMIKKKISDIVPDYICITGDLIDTYNVTMENVFKYFIDWLKDLSDISKVIISIGNHECIKMVNKDVLQNKNIGWLRKIACDRIIVLDNSIYDDFNITFIGYNPSFDYYCMNEKSSAKDLYKFDRLLSNVKNNYNILLIHTPSFVLSNKLSCNNIDLILCGHTHGGLMPSFFPGTFGIISPSGRLFPNCVRGKIKFGGCSLVISSGVVKLSERSNLSKYNGIFGSNINEINIFTKK